MDTEVARVLDAVGDEGRGRLLAVLASKFHDLDLAEEVVQEAFLRAAETWPITGLPARPQAWLMTAAKNRAIDLLHHDAMRCRYLDRLRIEDELRPGDHHDHADWIGDSAEAADIPDERLGLFFTCTHPTLREPERIALILRFLARLSTAEVAAAFLVDTTTMQQRIVRAKKRIQVAGIPFGTPTDQDVRQRLPGVLRAVYLIFTQGFSAATGSDHVRVDLQEEAIRLSRLLVNLLPDVTDVRGLLALQLLIRARVRARIDAEGAPIPLSEQDRSLWDSALIAEGLTLVRYAAGVKGAGRYTIQAAIAALHAEAPRFADTDWPQILILYRMLAEVEPSPVVGLNTAIALGRVNGPDAALTALEELGSDPRLARHRPYHIARAIALSELGRADESAAAYAAALECPGNDAESDYITARITANRR